MRCWRHIKLYLHYNFITASIFDPPALLFAMFCFVKRLLFFFTCFFFQKFESNKLNELSKYLKSNTLRPWVLVRMNLVRVRPPIIIPGRKWLFFVSGKDKDVPPRVNKFGGFFRLVHALPAEFSTGWKFMLLDIPFALKNANRAKNLNA